MARDARGSEPSVGVGRAEHPPEQGGWSLPITAEEVFDDFARGVAPVSPETAALLRKCGRDPVALRLIPGEPTWDVPHRLLAAVRWLVLVGEAEDFETASDPWSAFRAVLVERGEWVARFVRDQPVQTNEVQRCWALLPLFLTIVRATGAAARSD